MVIASMFAKHIDIKKQPIEGRDCWIRTRLTHQVPSASGPIRMVSVCPTLCLRALCESSSRARFGDPVELEGRPLRQPPPPLVAPADANFDTSEVCIGDVGSIEIARPSQRGGWAAANLEEEGLRITALWYRAPEARDMPSGGGRGGGGG